MIDQRAERFETLRRELVRHAYRMLGEYGEAEDVAQDAYLRWSAALDTTHVEDEHALARTIVTRLCLDRLRSARAKREVYVGPWLPEPVISEGNESPEAAATMADDISFALLLALERLAPLERAAFLLHDVLDVPFDEVASTLGEPSRRCANSRRVPASTCAIRAATRAPILPSCGACATHFSRRCKTTIRHCSRSCSPKTSSSPATAAARFPRPRLRWSDASASPACSSV